MGADKDRLDEIKEIIKSLSQGNKELQKRMEEFHEGMKELRERQKEFQEGQKELQEGQKELQEGQKELQEGQKELQEGQKELQEGQKELQERQKKTDEQLKKTDELLKETDELLKKTDEQLKKLSENLGGIGNSIGKIPEYMSLPKIESDFQKFNIKISEVRPNIRIIYDGMKKSKEVDLILIGIFNGKQVAVVVETQLRYRSSKEIDKFDRFITQELRQITHTYNRYKIIGCVCALGYGHGVQEYAEKLGLFVMKPVEKVVGIVNKPDFKPKLV
jgi:myosin heavy subunit